MLTWLSPLWLGALAALALPVALHLLGRGRVRRIEFGSVRLLREGTLSKRRSLRFHHPLLFAVRCLLLVALAAALAQPRARQPVGARQVEPLLLVERALLERRGALGAGHRELFERLDAARRGGARLSTLETGPPPWDLWSQLREADAAAAPGRPFEVFTLDRLALLVGERPAFDREVRWWSTSETREAPGGVPLTSAVRLRRRVLLAADAERQEDAGYLLAALAAAAQHSGVDLTSRRAAPRQAMAAFGEGADVVLWLSALPVPADLFAALEPGSRLVSDGAERWERVDSLFRVAGGESGVIGVSRLEPPDPAESERAETAPSAVLWEEVSGRPVLEASRREGVLWFRFRSRFHPAWTDLVGHPQLVRWAEDLLQGDAGDPGGDDRRAAGAEVAQPGRRAAGEGPERFPYRWPETLALSLVAVLFGVERWLAWSGAPRRERA
jgi:hypothetical protein